MNLSLPWRKPVVRLTEAEAEALAHLQRCRYCAGYHLGTCPYIEEIEVEGSRTRVRFHRNFAKLQKEIIYDE